MLLVSSCGCCDAGNSFMCGSTEVPKVGMSTSNASERDIVMKG